MQANSEMLIRIYTTSFVYKKNVQVKPSLLAHFDIKNVADYLKNIQI
jgi:hypothetical protein